MSRKFLVLSALALGLIVPASAKTYTRDEAVQTAIENSPDVKTAEEDAFSDWTMSKKHPQLRTLPKIWPVKWTTPDTPRQTLLTKT